MLVYLAYMPGGYKYNLKSALLPWELNNSKKMLTYNITMRVGSTLQIAEGCYHRGNVKVSQVEFHVFVKSADCVLFYM